MALPWLRLIDTAIGLVGYVRNRQTPAASLGPAGQPAPLEARPGFFGGIESRLAGVVVAALREAFDRDARRLDLEREHLEAERQRLEAERLRAERALRLELLRQAADREIGRLRLVAGVAVASFLSTLVVAARLAGGGSGARVLLGLGWLLLLAALGAVFSGQSQIEDAMQRETAPESSAAQLAPWFVVGALALVGIAALL